MKAYYSLFNPGEILRTATNDDILWKMNETWGDSAKSRKSSKTK